MCMHVIKEWLFVLGDKIRFAAAIANQVDIGALGTLASEAYDDTVGTRQLTEEEEETVETPAGYYLDGTPWTAEQAAIDRVNLHLRILETRREATAAGIDLAGQDYIHFLRRDV